MESKVKYPGFEIVADDMWDNEDEEEKREELARVLKVD